VFIITIVLAVLLSLVYAGGGLQKVTGAESGLKNADHVGASHGLWKGIGALELLAVVGLLVGLAVWPLGVAAGIGLVLLMAGAVVFHVRAGDTVKGFGPAVILGILALAEVIVRAASA
jgi:DoxX-like family